MKSASRMSARLILSSISHRCRAARRSIRPEIAESRHKALQFSRSDHLFRLFSRRLKKMAYAGEFDHVYWIGGGSGAGKSTIARRLAAEMDLHLLSTDDTMRDHARRSTPDDCPLLHQFMQMDMDERWLTRSPSVMLETFHWFRGEGFEMILEDLRALPKERRVIVEGFRLLPRLVEPHAAPGQAVWLLPTTAFRKQAFEARNVAAGFLSQTSDPARAWGNLVMRDAMFTDRLREESSERGLTSIEVGTQVEEANLGRRVRHALFG